VNEINQRNWTFCAKLRRNGSRTCFLSDNYAFWLMEVKIFEVSLTLLHLEDKRC